jgi:hypothetical protein
LFGGKARYELAHRLGGYQSAGFDPLDEFNNGEWHRASIPKGTAMIANARGHRERKNLYEIRSYNARTFESVRPTFRRSR